MEGWGKIGVQSASVLYPNSCYNESCYIEVQVYSLERVNFGTKNCSHYSETLIPLNWKLLQSYLFESLLTEKSRRLQFFNCLNLLL